jgi:polyisoprenoid-binding protein YceI
MKTAIINDTIREGEQQDSGHPSRRHFFGIKANQAIARSVVIAGLIFAGSWNVDTVNAKVGFSVKGPFGTVHGNFTGLKATIDFDEKNPGAGSIAASVDAKTVSTGVGMRNKHLRSEDQFFNTDKYPEISFHSKKIEKTATGYEAAGELTMKGVTKPVEIPFTFSNKEGAGLFKGQFTIKRADFSLGKPGGSIGEEVTIDLEVPVKK